MALALYAAHNAVLNKEKIRLRKNILYTKKKKIVCTELRKCCIEYNKKYFQIVKFLSNFVKMY